MLISMLRNGEVDWVWLAPPCTSDSAAQNGRRGGPLRTKTHLRGVDPDLPLVVMVGLLWGVALELLQIAASIGIHATIEHPATPYAWIRLETLKVAALIHGAVCAYANGCAFGEVGKLNPKKPSRFLKIPHNSHPG